VQETADKMTRCGFFSVFSIILGLPGETPADVARTLKLIKHLSTKRAVIFPIFHEPVLGECVNSEARFTLKNMRQDHLELYRRCYEQNFRWVPKLFWDNQRAGGVSWRKRLLMRVLGKTEVRTWRRTFARMAREMASKAEGS